jgi:glycerol-3-phosphate O-acyltransferase
MQSFHQSVIDVSRGIDRFFRAVFTPVVVDGPAFDMKEFQSRPHMLVSTHRSHVDYFLAGYVMIFRGIKNLRFAAGDNLTKLPYIGPRFRAFGAFTVAREIAFKRDYVQRLCSRVVEMMENLEAVLVFPEGGRSYSGATLEVKSGVLGAAVLQQARRPDEDVLLLPMAISYEFPPDAPWFSLLLKGKSLRKRSQPFLKRALGAVFYFGADILAFVPFLLARKTRRTYGKAYLDYDAPVPVRSLIDVEAGADADAKDDFFKYRASMLRLADLMRARFLALFRILPQHLLAAIVKEKNGITATDAEKQLPQLLDTLRAAGRNLKSAENLTPAEIVAQGQKNLLRLKAISLKGGMFFVRKKAMLDYCAAPVCETTAPPKGR